MRINSLSNNIQKIKSQIGINNIKVPNIDKKTKLCLYIAALSLAGIGTYKAVDTFLDKDKFEKVSTESPKPIDKKPYYDRSKTTDIPEVYKVGMKAVAKKMNISSSELNQFITSTAKKTGYSEYFIKHLVAMEKYEPEVKNTGDGTYTGGFGHTALKDKNIKKGDKVSPRQAFNWLAEDIKFFESKIKSMKLNSYGKETIGDHFNNLPLSIKEAIIDVAFNRDAQKIEKAEEYLSLRANIKGGEENLPATAVRLCQNFSRYTFEQKKKHRFTTGLMYRNTYRFMLAIRDLNDEYRAIAKRRFENFDSYYSTTIKLKQFKDDHEDVRMLKKTWNQF